jgi:hypothetical protein
MFGDTTAIQNEPASQLSDSEKTGMPPRSRKHRRTPVNAKARGERIKLAPSHDLIEA